MKKKNFLICILLFFAFQIATSQTPVYYLQSEKIDSARRPFRKAGIPLIADINKDGQKEIICFVVDYEGISNPIGNLHIIKSDGSNYPGFPKGMSDYPLDIASGDVNGDGFLDIALRYTYNIDIIDRYC